MSVLDEFEDKLAALRRWVREASPPFQSAEAYQAFPLLEAEIGRAERRFDLTLPPEYRAFLRRFGAGQAWPGNVFPDHLRGLTPASRAPFPLSQPMLGMCSPPVHPLPEEEEQFGPLLELWDAVPKGDGVLPFCSYGCGIDAVLVLNGPFADRVWIAAGDAAYYGPFGGSEPQHGGDVSTQWVPTDSPRDYSFFEWYGDWLDRRLFDYEHYGGHD